MAGATTKRDARHDGRDPEIQARVAALLSVLDEDIRHIEATLLRLDALRGSLIKRDDEGLRKLLEEIQEQSQAYAATELRRQTLRRELAAGLGLPDGDLTLSGLVSRLTGQDRASVAERQTRLKFLVARLKREHTQTSLLIADCAKFNRSLLRVFLGPDGKTGTTYSPTGAARHPTGVALLNMQL